MSEYRCKYGTDRKTASETHRRIMMAHNCKHTYYRCQEDTLAGSILCTIDNIIVDSDPSTCPICGEKSSVIGRTTDGRHVRSCGDAHEPPSAHLVAD